MACDGRCCLLLNECTLFVKLIEKEFKDIHVMCKMKVAAEWHAAGRGPAAGRKPVQDEMRWTFSTYAKDQRKLLPYMLI